MVLIEPRALHIKSKCLASELYSVSGFSILKYIKPVSVLVNSISVTVLLWAEWQDILPDLSTFS